MDANPPPDRRPLVLLFFCATMPLAMWNVPLSNVLGHLGRANLVPLMLATTSVAAFISPLFAGALADQKISPTRLLRLLTLVTALAMCLTCTALAYGWPDLVVLLCAQVQALVTAPIWSVATSIVLSRLSDPAKQFGPIRAFATLGWMAGCWIISFVLHSDTSLASGYAAAGCWLGVMALTWMLPVIPPGDAQEHRTWKQVLGLDALSLLRHRDHQVVFITAALYSIPLAAFYPYTAPNLRDLGVEQVSAVMSLAQTTEVISMLLLAGVLARFRLKWVFLSGIAFCVLRYGLNALGTLPAVVVGTTLHGFAFTLYFITTQIYLEQRIEPRWRVRAQALLALLMGGFGNMIGYLGGGWWHAACTSADGKVDWSRFWWGETALTALVCVFFAVAYRGRRQETAGRLPRAK